ncbi:MAG TPA: hypothetical protein VKQ36_01335, partial [Ktedonobacterales bacterium]|nr:hypothetical protein [Ktedonobacterales bacterium]
WALALGQLAQARTQAEEATRLADDEGDEMARVEAAVILAEMELQADNLNAAVAAYNQALALAQACEATTAELLATLGLGRILLRRGLWEEAANAHQEALPRLRATEDVAALGLAQLGLGEAKRNLGDLMAAQRAFNEAQRLFTASDDALGLIEAWRGEARTLMVAPELEAAVGRYTQAIKRLTQVGEHVADLEARASLFDAQALLYAETIYALASEQSATRATELARDYGGRAGKAGRAALTQRLREYEQTLKATDADVPEEEAHRNKTTAQALAAIRKVIGK